MQYNVFKKGVNLMNELIFVSNIAKCKVYLYEKLAKACDVNIIIRPAVKFLTSASNDVSVWVSNEDDCEKIIETGVRLERLICRFLKEKGLYEFSLKENGSFEQFFDEKNPEAFHLTDNELSSLVKEVNG